MKRQILSAAALLMFSTVSASAADSGFYFGVLGGNANYDFERYPIVEFNPGVPAFPIDFEFTAPAPGALSGFVAAPAAVVFPIGWQPGDDDRSSAFGGLAGFRFNQFAALETTYLDFGTLKSSATLDLYPSGQSTYRRELHSTGATISALGTWPITGSWSVHARAGALFMTMKVKTSIGSFSDDISSGSQNFLWGAGAQYHWGTHWSARLDFQRFDGVGSVSEAGRADIDTLTLGVLFRL